MSVMMREIRKERMKMASSGFRLKNGPSTGSRKEKDILATHEFSHHGIHVHHVLLCNLLIELVGYHHRKKQGSSVAQRPKDVGDSREKSNGKPAHDSERPDVSLKQSLKHALILSKARDLQA